MVQRTSQIRRGRGPQQPLITKELERLRKKPPRASKTEPLSQLDRLAILNGIRDGDALARIATQWKRWSAARIGRALGVNEATVRRFRSSFWGDPERLLELRFSVERARQRYSTATAATAQQ